MADLAGAGRGVPAAGLEVDARLELPEVALPGGVDVSAYRVVQEALTNALKHADGAARLTVTADGAALRIRCDNQVGPGRGTGSGLA